jgi:2-(1,2-epoxy-1,2-dihydrophenyl)acetyl-CoA isomerase
MAFRFITLDLDGPVAVLTLNRPDKLNSFTGAMHREVKDALDKIENSGARAMFLTGAGRGFCAGQDLADPEFDIAANFDAAVALEEYYNPLVKRLKSLPFPVICAVNGVAAGAGANIALACDIVLAARSASFLQAFARIGLVPDAGGTWSLARLVGEARAKGLAMLAEPLSAETAECWGLIWKVVDDHDLMAEARSLAERLASQPTRALALIKQAIHAAASNDFAVQLELEKDLQHQAGKTEDFREGVAAFLEKRKARFKGR